MNGCRGCESRQLGAIPAAIEIGGRIIAWMITDRLSAGQAASMAAQQYDEFKRMKEAEITGLALYLADNSDLPYWEWFNTLRSAQAYKLSQPDQPTNGEPPLLVKEGTPQWAWILLVAVGGLALLMVMEG